MADTTNAEPRRPPSWFTPATIFVALSLFGFQTARLWFVNDDAYISFRYARNLARGLGLRYNSDESPPVEGYSNFLWTLLCSSFEWLGLNPVLLAPAVGVACGAALIAVVCRRLARFQLAPPAIIFGTLFVATFPPMALWATSGLETMAFALAVYWFADALILEPGRPRTAAAIVAGISLCLIRSEGPAWAVVLMALAVASRGIDGEWRASRSTLARIGATLAAVVIAFFAWRYAYHGSLVPNTAVAKSGLLRLRFGRGVDYVLSFLATFVSPALLLVVSPFVLLSGARRGVWLAVVAMAFAFPVYSVVVTGDFMPMGRFLVPSVAFWALLAGKLLDWVTGRARVVRAAVAVALGAAVIAVHALPAWNIHLAPRATLARFHFRHNSPDFVTEYEAWQNQKKNVEDWTQLGLALRKFGPARDPRSTEPSVVLGGIGAAGYFSGFHVFDRYGLVSPRVAGRRVAADEPLRSAGHDRGVAAEFFVEDRPTILNFSQLTLANRTQAKKAARQVAATLRDKTALLIGLDEYAPDLWRISELDSSDRADYLIVWVHVGRQRVAAAWSEFEKKVDGL